MHPVRKIIFISTVAIPILTLHGLAPVLEVEPVTAGGYLDSAHGDVINGVCRGGICSGASPSGDYSRGNCSNCHEPHASLDGSEPVPADGTPSFFSLFTKNFYIAVTGYPYLESDNICFACHDDLGSVMQVTNYTYAQTFGGFVPDTPITSIMDAFNTALKEGHTEHNLKDIYTYANSHFSYFSDYSNPCLACHNPHMAKRNKSEVDNPVLTAISRPSDHDNLWGDEAGETMKDLAASSGGVYQPPYYFGSTTTYEPGGIADHDGSKMPDYNSLCLDCHGNNDVYSTVYGRYLQQIDWGPAGDIHGGSPRFAGDYVSGAELRPPYLDNNGGTSPNYVLACVDCHEPHGTILYNYGGYPSYLYRREVNGEELGCEGCGWPLNEADYTVMDLCLRCHTVSKHCGSQWECATCHMHGHTAERGCVGGLTGLWNQKVF